MTQAVVRITDFKLVPADDLSAIASDRLELLRLYEGGSNYEAIALAKTIPVGTVKSRINRARLRILAQRAAAAPASAQGGAA
jgi:hypothetical protein